jgi:PAS domain S-box-containing protein
MGTTTGNTIKPPHLYLPHPGNAANRTASPINNASLQQEIAIKNALLNLCEKVGGTGSFNWNLQTNCISCSPGLLNILAIKADNFNGNLQTLIDCTHKEDLPLVRFTVEKILAEKKSSHELNLPTSWRIVGPNKEIKLIKIENELLFNQQGGVAHIIGVVHDITEQVDNRKALMREKSLLESAGKVAKFGSWEYDVEENYESIAESVPGVVLRYKHNPDGTDELLYLNQQVEEIHEIPVEEALNDISLMWEAIHPDDVEGFTNSVRHSAETLTYWEMEFRIISRGGKTKWLRGKGTPKETETGAVIWNTILIDITSLKEITRHLTKKNAEAEEINRQLRNINEQLDTFVYRVSHDLRAPIASSIGLTQLSLHSNNLDEMHQYDEMELKSLTRLDNFIQDILNFSRNARLEVAREPVDICELIVDIIGDNQAKIDEAGVKVSYEVNGNKTFISDRLRVQTILKNLISNAIKYQQPNSDNPQVNVTISVSNTQATIIIADNGIGIRKEHQPDIFKMFYRATELNVGSGLGLYIVKDCVDKLKGTLTFNSEYRKGSTFTVVLPHSNAN